MKTFNALALAAALALVGSAAQAQTRYAISPSPTWSTTAPQAEYQGLYTGRSVAVRPADRNSADGSRCGQDLAAICTQ